jgi:hypothetical protein
MTLTVHGNTYYATTEADVFRLLLRALYSRGTRCIAHSAPAEA